MIGDLPRMGPGVPHRRCEFAMNDRSLSRSESTRLTADHGTECVFLRADLIDRLPGRMIHVPVERHEPDRGERHDTSVCELI